jgi:ubiquinone/menaquinone biosynthesis C-methylase UbiE
MSTETRTLDAQDLERRVKEMYREVAEEPHKEFHFETGRALAERLGYPVPELDAIPAESIDSFAGVGYYFDLARLQAGETIVDLGSGSGMDSFIASRAVGESGRVIGIDMTAAQIAKSRRLAADGGFANTEFVDAHIEQLLLPDASADVVVSNGVINLAPDKPAVFAEAARVLRPRGRLALADIVSNTQLPIGITCDASLWAACIGGAMQRDDYREAIETAGFELEDLKENDDYRFISQRAENATEKYGVRSISLLAIRR